MTTSASLFGERSLHTHVTDGPAVCTSFDDCRPSETIAAEYYEDQIFPTMAMRGAISSNLSFLGKLPSESASFQKSILVAMSL